MTASVRRCARLVAAVFATGITIGTAFSCAPPGEDPLFGGEVTPGLDRIAAEGAGDLAGQRVGLITNHTGRTRDDHAAAVVLEEAGVEVTRLFSPEHGITGAAAAGEEVASGTDPETGLPVVSLYGEARTPNEAALAGLDALVFDIQDIGVRFYTYISTLRNAILAANEAGLDFWVLDRPNPNGGDRVEGPVLDPRFRSFVGADTIPLLHGMTVGELAGLFAAREGATVRVVPVANLTRATRWEDTGLPWRPPSPNIPTLHTARVYPGFGLFEGVALSEGRGTTAPFERVGAPWADPDRWLDALGGANGVPGLHIETTQFTPYPLEAAPNPRFAGETLHGLSIEMTDLDALRPVRAGLLAIEAVRRTHPEHFGWRQAGDSYWLDQLLGTDRVRRGIEAGESVAALMDAEDAALVPFLRGREAHLLYR